jgi:hypothetical protein
MRFLISAVSPSNHCKRLKMKKNLGYKGLMSARKQYFKRKYGKLGTAVETKIVIAQ